MNKPHLNNGDLEAYALGHMPAELRDATDEHLLVCELCRHGLDGEDRFLGTIRTALGDEPAS
jgi:hypothetical protein